MTQQPHATDRIPNTSFRKKVARGYGEIFVTLCDRFGAHGNVFGRSVAAGFLFTVEHGGRSAQYCISTKKIGDARCHRKLAETIVNRINERLRP